MKQQHSSDIKKKSPKKTSKKAESAVGIRANQGIVRKSVGKSTAACKINFQLRYATQFGQQIFVIGNHPLLGDEKVEQALPLHYFNENYWMTSLELSAETVPEKGITYHYFIRQQDGSIDHEWGNNKLITLTDAKLKELTLIDSWNYAGYIENAFDTEPFQQVLLKRTALAEKHASPKQKNTSHTFVVKAPLLKEQETICLLGNAKSLGGWSTDDPLLLSYDPSTASFTGTFDLSGDDFPIAYKYGVYNLKEKKFVRFEDGNNRVTYEHAKKNTCIKLHDGFVWLPNTTWKGAGMAIPVFSLRSEKSFGVGEFSDLKLLTDWAASVGLKMIQLLPVNDTTATHTNADSYPYAAISAFALHPMYLHLPTLADTEGKAALAELELLRNELNGNATVAYDQVNNIKDEFCRSVYERIGKTTFRTKSYQEFFSTQQHWLKPYAAFCYFRDTYQTIRFEEWPANTTWEEQLHGPYFDSQSDTPEGIGMGYYCFLQYHLNEQLKDATRYAHSKGIIVKGDIAIGVYRHGADVWQHPELFHLEYQAGAPPDDFAVSGQNWGFPTYNWQRMKETSFAWWKQRFSQMSEYFDAFRIDHILGFFRIWSIPYHAVEGIMGHFVPALPVHREEFFARGIHLSHERLTAPFINEKVLWEIFGYDNELVKSIFLDSTDSGQYQLKAAFATQRQVEIYFAEKEQDEHHLKIRQGLYKLLSNVICFQSNNAPDAFHFRYAMDQTPSYHQLPDELKGALHDLYIDYFFRRQDQFWMQEALQKLPALKRETNMLICGEDLGMVPGCVPQVMQQLGLLSLEIQRMPKDSAKQFFHPNDAPYLSVVTPSTHDMSTIRGWWEENSQATTDFYHHELGQLGTPPFYCEAWINKAIVVQHLYSPAMWCVFQFQDLLGIDASLRRTHPADERINIPADSNHFWNYRMHLTIEELQQATAYNEELGYLIESSGR
jgi:4-alpha-glucanotransferase